MVIGTDALNLVQAVLASRHTLNVDPFLPSGGSRKRVWQIPTLFS